jgi:undecaprenyl diphosphate synthase
MLVLRVACVECERVKATELLKPANKEETALLDKLDPRRFPRHLAVIMDGNGRWAERRHLPRVAGHRAGVKAAREIIETSARLKLSMLTLYAFSLENWRRPQAEIDFLMRLLREYLKRELPTIHRNNIRLLVIGRSEQLPEGVRRDIDEAMRYTAQNTGMKLVVALNYGGRAELVDAFKRFRSISTPPGCPIPICSSAPAAKCASAIFCCGRSPTPKST